MEKLIIKQVGNPLDREGVLVEFDYTGQTVGELVKAIIPEEMEYKVFVNGQVVSEDTVVELTDKVVVYPNVGVPAVLAVMAYIKAAYAAIQAAWAAFSVAYPMLAKGLALVGKGLLMAGVGTVMQKLFAPKTSNTSGSGIETGNAYSWNPHITQEQGVVVPKYYGKLRAKSGNIIVAFRSDVSGFNANAINCIVGYGYGPIKSIIDVKINDQYESEDDGLELQRRLGYVSQTAMTGFGQSVIEFNPGFNLDEPGDYYTYDLAAGYDKIGFAIRFPSGLARMGENGNIPTTVRFGAYLENQTTLAKSYFSTSADSIAMAPTVLWSFGEWKKDVLDYQEGSTYSDTYWVQYNTSTNVVLTKAELETEDTAHPGAFWRQVASNKVYSYASETISVKGESADSCDVNCFVNVNSSYAYKLYIRRLSAHGNDKIDQASLGAVYGISQEKFSYPRHVMLAVKGAPSERFNSSLQIEPIIEGSLVRVYNGTSWTVEYSQNPAWIAYDVATQPVFNNNLTVARYDGIHPDNVSLQDFYTWATYCDELVPDGNSGTEKRFVANVVFDEEDSLWDALCKFGSPFNCSPYWNGSELKLYLDIPGESVQFFSEATMLKDSFKQNFTAWEDRVTEVELKFMDEESDYEVTQIAIIDADLTQKTNKLSYTAVGTTKASQAWRIGKKLLAANKYIFRTIEFQVFTEALDATLGDVITVQHNLPDWGQGGMLAAVNNTEKTVYIEGLLLTDAVYLKLGFNQATIDGWRAGTGSGQVINTQILRDVTLHLRTDDGVYAIYNVYGGGYLSGQTVIILQSTQAYTTAPAKNTVYSLTITSEGSLRQFRIAQIDLADEFVTSIKAVEYRAEVYQEADGTPVINTTSIGTIHDKFPKVTSVSAVTRTKVTTGNIFSRDIHLSWSLPTDKFYFAKVKIYYQTSEDNVEFDDLVYAGSASNTTFVIRNVKLKDYYKVILTTVNTLNAECQKSAGAMINFQAADLVNIEIPYIDSGIDGLRVLNSTGDNLTFNQPNCMIGWSEPTGKWANTNWLNYYKVNIYQVGTQTVLYTINNGKLNYFDFTFSLNAHTASGPYRTFDVGVQAIDMLDRAGVETTMRPVNAQAGQVQDVATAQFIGGAKVSWTLLTTPDISGYEVHCSQVGAAFTPSSATLYATVSAAQFTTDCYLNDGLWYIKVGAFDCFSRTGITYSTAASVTINREIAVSNVTDFEEGLSNTYKVPIHDGVSWTVNANILSWNAHVIVYMGTRYNIAAGNTTLSAPYVYWQSLGGSYSTTASLDTFNALNPATNQWQMAINYGTYYKLAWVAQANQVIGSAWIGQLAVQNAQIGNEIWSDNFSYTPGVAMTGWKINKLGKIMANDLEVYSSDGTLLIDGNWQENDFNQLALTSSNLQFNSNMRAVAKDGRPAGAKATYGSAVTTNIKYNDSAKTILELSNATDDSIGVSFPAFRVVAGTQYTITANVACTGSDATSGFYMRVYEYDSELAAGVDTIAYTTAEAGCVLGTRIKAITPTYENVAISTVVSEKSATYVPTATAKWASVTLLRWTGMTTARALLVHGLSVTNNATAHHTFYQTAEPTSGMVIGDLWYNSTTKLTKRWSGTAWDTTGNAYDNTNLLTDGAGLGTTATWTGVTGTGKPADNATVGATWGTDINSLPGEFGSANLCLGRYSYFNDADFSAFIVSAGTRSYDTGYIGTYSIKLTATALNNYCFLGASLTDYNVVISPNSKWVVSAFVKSSIASGSGQFYLKTSDGVTSSAISFTTSATVGAWTRVYGVIDLSANTSTKLVLRVDNETNAGNSMWFDGIMLEKVVGVQTTPSNYVKPAESVDFDDYRISNISLENGVLAITQPQGGTYSYSGTATGAIVVTLPNSWTGSMLKFAIDVFLYVGANSFSANVGGYTSIATLAWMNTTASIVGSTASNNRIRFGHNGTKCCIIIGQAATDGTASTWSYPKIAVKNLQVGHYSATADLWKTGWSVSVVNSLTGYTFSGTDFADALLDAKSILDQGAFATLNQITEANIATYIASAAIGTAFIKDAAITNAKIDTLLASKLYVTSGTIAAALIGTGHILNAMIGNAAITTAKIGDLEVETIKVANNAITIPSSYYAASAFTLTATAQTIMTLTYTSTGAPVLLTASCILKEDSAYDCKFSIRIYGGTTGTTLLADPDINLVTGGNTETSFSLSIKDSSTTTGTRVYVVKAYSNRDSNSWAQYRSLIALEVKK